MGVFASATGNGSTAMGFATNSAGVYSTAIGFCACASGCRSIAMGSITRAMGCISTAMGSATWACGNISTAMGFCTKTFANSSVVLGQCTQIGNTSTKMFAVGFGTDVQSTTAYDYNIHFSVDCGGLTCTKQLKIVDGTEGLNRVLMSDANGVASWRTAVSTVNCSITGTTSTESAIVNILATTSAIGSSIVCIQASRTGVAGITCIEMNSPTIKLVGLPTTNPAVLGALWNNNGVLSISAG